jgi:hypothetical protein
MKDYNDSLHFLLEWYRVNGYKPIPQVSQSHPDADVFAQYFTDEVGEISHDGLYNGYLEEMQIQARALPLVAACMSGITGDALAEIVLHHSVSSLSLSASFSTTDKALRDVHGKMVETFPVFLACIKAIIKNDSGKVRTSYHKGFNDSLMVLAFVHMDSAEFWPKTIMLEYQDALEGSTEVSQKAFRAPMHNFMEWVRDEHHLPRDDSGIRYDWFLERSGMLLPVVTRKSLGRFTLWEDFLDIAATVPGNSAIQGLMDYCIHHAPESMRPAIYNGFRSMKIESGETLDNGDHMITFMQERFAGTWLEPLTVDPLLKLNLIGKERVLAIHIAEHPELFAELQSLPGKHLNNFFQSLAQMPSTDFGYEVFSALPYFICHPQNLDPVFDHEAFVAHALNGLDSFLGAEGRVEFDGRDEIHDYSIDTCLRLAKAFIDPKTVDYTKFRSLSSRSILVLKEAGLDIKQLPVMNNRDRGRALEMEIGI